MNAKTIPPDAVVVAYEPLSNHSNSGGKVLFGKMGMLHSSPPINPLRRSLLENVDVKAKKHSGNDSLFAIDH